MKQTTTPKKAPSPPKIKVRSVAKGSNNPTNLFVAMVLDMTWKLAIVVLVPILVGNWLNHKYSNAIFLIAGILVALVLVILVIKNSYNMANQISKKDQNAK